MSLLPKALAYSTEKMIKVNPRKDNTPAFLHPIRVAMTLASSGCDEETIIIGLLHDVIEDCEVTEADLEREFNTEIARLVSALSHGKGDSTQSTISKVRSGGDIAIMVKLADNMDNIRTILSFRPEKREAYLQYAQNIQDLAKEMIPNSILTHKHYLAIQRAKGLVNSVQ